MLKRQYYIYFIKHISGHTMRYGIYDSFIDAFKALTKANKINPTDEWYMESRKVTQ